METLKISPSVLVNTKSSSLDVVAAIRSDIECEGLPLDVSFVIDDSGSMSSVKRNVWEVVRFVCSNLGPQDHTSAIKFDDNCTTCWDWCDDNNKAYDMACEEADRSTGGCTNISKALEQAVASMAVQKRRRPGACPVLVILTDGQPNAGIQDPRSLGKFLKNQLESAGLMAPTQGEGEVMTPFGSTYGQKKRHGSLFSKASRVFSRMSRSIHKSKANGSAVTDNCQSLDTDARSPIQNSVSSDAVAAPNDDCLVVVFGLGSVRPETLRALAVSDHDFSLVQSQQDVAELASQVLVKTKRRPLREVHLTLQPANTGTSVQGTTPLGDHTSVNIQDNQVQFNVGSSLATGVLRGCVLSVPIKHDLAKEGVEWTVNVTYRIASDPLTVMEAQAQVAVPAYDRRGGEVGEELRDHYTIAMIAHSSHLLIEYERTKEKATLEKAIALLTEDQPAWFAARQDVVQALESMRSMKELHSRGDVGGSHSYARQLRSKMAVNSKSCDYYQDMLEQCSAQLSMPSDEGNKPSDEGNKFHIFKKKVK